MKGWRSVEPESRELAWRRISLGRERRAHLR
jgi:hypothetical protein